MDREREREWGDSKGQRDSVSRYILCEKGESTSIPNLVIRSSIYFCVTNDWIIIATWQWKWHLLVMSAPAPTQIVLIQDYNEASF